MKKGTGEWTGKEGFSSIPSNHGLPGPLFSCVCSEVCLVRYSDCQGTDLEVEERR